MLALLGALALFGAPAAARPTDSAAASDRHAILGVLRQPVEARLGRPIEFVVAMLRQNKTWAFVQAEPQRPSGKLINGRHLFGARWQDMDGLTTTAILHKGARGWRIVEVRIGATDAWYCGYVATEKFDPCSTSEANE